VLTRTLFALASSHANPLVPSSPRIEPVAFLDFVLARRGAAVQIRLRTENTRRFRRRMRELRALHAAGAVEIDKVTSRVRAWLAHARHGHTRSLCRLVLAELSFSRASP
jgi:hypothetical protein